jgi:hypothetical protein
MVTVNWIINTVSYPMLAMDQVESPSRDWRRLGEQPWSRLYAVL